MKARRVVSIAGAVVLTAFLVVGTFFATEVVSEALYYTGNSHFSFIVLLFALTGVIGLSFWALLYFLKRFVFVAIASAFVLVVCLAFGTLVANELASIALYERGYYTTAAKLYRVNVIAWEKIFGLEHRRTAQSINNLADLLHSKSDYAAAESMYRRALEIRKKILGVEHEDTAETIHNLAGLLHAKGDYATAESMYRRALAIREKVLGVEHEDTAEAIDYLADLLHAKAITRPPNRCIAAL